MIPAGAPLGALACPAHHLPINDRCCCTPVHFVRHYW